MDKAKKAKRKAEIAELRRKVKEMESQLASSYHFASVTLAKAGGLAGSAVILELTALGGKAIIPPVAIRGGLSAETIAAIQEELTRSYSEAIEFRPIGYRKESA